MYIQTTTRLIKVKETFSEVIGEIHEKLGKDYLCRFTEISGQKELSVYVNPKYIVEIFD